jgi:hypothetical protein
MALKLIAGRFTIMTLVTCKQEEVTVSSFFTILCPITIKHVE